MAHIRYKGTFCSIGGLGDVPRSLELPCPLVDQFLEALVVTFELRFGLHFRDQAAPRNARQGVGHRNHDKAANARPEHMQPPFSEVVFDGEAGQHVKRIIRNLPETIKTFNAIRRTLFEITASLHPFRHKPQDRVFRHAFAHVLIERRMASHQTHFAIAHQHRAVRTQIQRTVKRLQPGQLNDDIHQAGKTAIVEIDTSAERYRPGSQRS